MRECATERDQATDEGRKVLGKSALLQAKKIEGPVQVLVALWYKSRRNWQGAERSTVERAEKPRYSKDVERSSDVGTCTVETENVTNVEAKF